MQIIGVQIRKYLRFWWKQNWLLCKGLLKASKFSGIESTVNYGKNFAQFRRFFIHIKLGFFKLGLAMQEGWLEL